MEYWMIRDQEKRIVGHVRIEEETMQVQLKTPLQVDWFLLKGKEVNTISTERPFLRNGADGIAGAVKGRLLYYGCASACPRPWHETFFNVSHFYTKQKERETTITSVLEKREPSAAIQSAAPPKPQPTPSAEQPKARERDVAPTADVFAEEPMQQPVPAQAEPEEEAAETARQPDPIEKTEADAHAFAALLRRAESVYSRLETVHPPMRHADVDNMVQKVDNPTEQEAFAPSDEAAVPKDTEAGLLETASVQTADWREEAERIMQTARSGGTAAHTERLVILPNAFPNARWTFVARQGYLPHYEGVWQNGTERVRILAVRAPYAPRPPRGLQGFTRHVQDEDGGFWVRLLPYPAAKK